MSISSASPALDQLVALNDEIAALVRAGVPLEKGLRELADDWPGRSGQLARELAAGLQRGESLESLLAAKPEVYPPVYRAVVAAGLRSGRLAAALESLATTARRMLDARQILLSAIIYPVIVLLVAWGLFIYFVLEIAPVFYAATSDWGAAGRGFLGWIVGLGSTAHLWGPVVPAAVLIVVLLWAYATSRASALLATPGRFLAWLPWTRRMLRAHRTAMFAEVLALLVENRTPLADALPLAADAVGDPAMQRAARDLAGAIERGEPIDAAARRAAAFPPLLEWMIVQDPAGLVPGLRRAAANHHRLAAQAADWARLWTPVVLTLALGGTVTAAYVFTVFGSWILLLRALSG